MIMNWEALFATLFARKTREAALRVTRLMFGSRIVLEQLREMIDGEAEVLMFPMACDLGKATLKDVLTEGEIIGQGKAVVSRLYQVDIKDFVVNSESWHTDDSVGIGLLQEKRGRLIFMPKCDIFCFHNRELNIFPQPIPRNDYITRVMVIPIKRIE